MTQVNKREKKMRIGLSALVIFSLLLIASGSLLACSGANAGNADLSIPVIAPFTPSGSFKVDALTINPDEVNAGVQALITAKITNTGIIDDDYRGNIRIDSLDRASLPNFLPSEKVRIQAGATQLLSVTTTVNYAGTYKVTWDDVIQTLKVNPEETSSAGNTRDSSPRPAPDFSAVDVVTGKTVSLKQYAGTPILLNFVNYGCNPSLNNIVSAQLLAIKQLQEERGGFVPVSVFCGCCPPEVLRQFAKDNQLNWPWILDSDYSIVKKYGSYLKKFGYPTLIFIDKDQLITDFAGYTDLTTLKDKMNKIGLVQVK